MRICIYLKKVSGYIKHIVSRNLPDDSTDYVMFDLIEFVFYFVIAVDRSQTSSLSDAREALINAAVDALGTVKVISGPSHGLMCPMAIRLLPLYLLALLKHVSIFYYLNINKSKCAYKI